MANLNPLIKYFTNLIRMGIKTGAVPKLHRVGRAVQSGDMSRRDFFKTVKLIKEEAVAQADLLSTGAKMEGRRKRASLILESNKPTLNIMDKARDKSVKRISGITKKETQKQRKKFGALSKKELNTKTKYKLRYDAEERYWESPRSPEDKAELSEYASNLGSTIKNMSKKDKLAEVTSEWKNMMIPGWRKRQNIIFKKILRDSGVTQKTEQTIKRAQSTLRGGSPTSEIDKKLLDEWFKNRRRLQKITKEDVTRLGAYTFKHKSNRNWNAQNPSGLDFEPVVKEVKKAVQEVSKYGENKIESIWRELSKEFKKGLYGVKELPRK